MTQTCKVSDFSIYVMQILQAQELWKMHSDNALAVVDAQQKLG